MNAVERRADGHQQTPDRSGWQSKQGTAGSAQSEPLALLSTLLPSCGKEGTGQEVNEASSSRSSLENVEIKIGVQADVERVGHPAAERAGAGTTDQHQEIYESLHAYEAAVYKRRLEEEMIQHQLSKLVCLFTSTSLGDHLLFLLPYTAHRCRVVGIALQATEAARANVIPCTRSKPTTSEQAFHNHVSVRDDTHQIQNKS